MLRVNNLSGFGGGRRLHTLTFVASATSVTHQVTIPAGAQAGDLGVLADYSYTFGGPPALVTPTNWTAWSGTELQLTAGSDTWAGQLSYKILTSGDPSLAITGINGDDDRKVLFVFRGNQPITLITASTPNAVLQNADPGSQTVSAAGQGVPLVVIGAVGENTAAFSTASPAFDSTVINGDSHLRAGYKIYNSSPADHTIDMNDLGTGNYLASGYLSVS